MPYALVNASGAIDEVFTKPYAHLVIQEGQRMLQYTPPPYDEELETATPVEPVDAQASVVSFVVNPKPPEITQPILLKRKVAVIQGHLDTKAKELGYDGILSASSYNGSQHPKFGPEGSAYFQWRDACWDYGYTVLSEVQAGTRPLPSDAELIAELPQFGL